MAYEITDKYVWKEVGMQVVILHYDTGVYWTLNESASSIWKALMDGCSVKEAAQRVADEFDIAMDSARSDVEVFVADCTDKKILIAV
jgi:hypothetical protein